MDCLTNAGMIDLANGDVDGTTRRAARLYQERFSNRQVLIRLDKKDETEVRELMPQQMQL